MDNHRFFYVYLLKNLLDYEFLSPQERSQLAKQDQLQQAFDLMSEQIGNIE